MVTLGKMGHSWKWLTTGKNGSQLKNWVTLGKLGHNWKNGSPLDKMGHILRNGLQLEYRVTLEEMGDT